MCDIVFSEGRKLLSVRFPPPPFVFVSVMGNNMKAM